MPGANGLDPTDQQKAGEDIDGQVNAGVFRQEGQVGQDAQRSKGEHTPEVAIPEKYPAGKESRQPGGDQQPHGKGQRVDADPFVASGEHPVPKAIK